jgi:hypothetical protein
MIAERIKQTLQAAYRTGHIRCGCPVEFMTPRDIAAGMQRLTGWCVSYSAIQAALDEGIPGVKYVKKRNAYALVAACR